MCLCVCVSTNQQVLVRAAYDAADCCVVVVVVVVVVVATAEWHHSQSRGQSQVSDPE